MLWPPAWVGIGCRPVPRCPSGLSLGVNEPKEMAPQEAGADGPGDDRMSCEETGHGLALVLA